MSKWANRTGPSPRRATNVSRNPKQEHFRRIPEVPVERLSKWQIAAVPRQQDAQSEQKVSGQDSKVSAPGYRSGIEPSHPRRTFDSAPAERENHPQSKPLSTPSFRQPINHLANEESATTKNRPNRVAYKERRSLVSGREARSPDVPRRHETLRTTSRPKATEKEKPKRYIPKRINPEIFIPGVISVGNFAKLLGVRLGLFAQLYYLRSIDSPRSFAAENGPGRDGA